MIEDQDAQHAPDPAALLKAAKDALSASEYLRKYRKIDWFKPYRPQKEFFAHGKVKRERLFRCANQSGKSVAAMVEAVFHSTGEYPDWWDGQRFDAPVQIVIASETSLLTRDVDQSLLCGPAGVDELLGTGYLPLASIVGRPSMARGVTDAFDTLQVRHISGGISTIKFRSYQAGREAFYGATLDVVILDEPCPAEVYSEALTRISARPMGRMLVVFTPITGSTDVTRKFSETDHPDRAMTTMSLYDVAAERHGHLTLEQVKQREASYETYEVPTRIYGLPMQGQGSVFPVNAEVISEPPIPNVPDEWFKIWGLDFGIAHPFAAVLLLHDRDADVVHVHACVRMKDAIPLAHCVPIKRIAANVKCAYPSDGDNRETGSGTTLAALYREQDLQMLPAPARWEDGSVSTERGVAEILSRMRTNRFKVASTLREWFEEFSEYHRKDGLIVKVRDDLMSATRIGIMDLRRARQGPIGPLPAFGRRFKPGEGGDNQEAFRRRSEFDIWTGEAPEHPPGSNAWAAGLRDPRLGRGRIPDIDAFTGDPID